MNLADELERLAKAAPHEKWLHGHMSSLGEYVYNNLPAILRKLRAEPSLAPGALTGAVRFLEDLAAGKVTEESECASASMAWDVVQQFERAALRGEPDAGEVERAAEAVYRSLYERHGGKWEAVETRDVWRDIARAALTAARSRPLTETVAACRALPWPGDGHD